MIFFSIIIPVYNVEDYIDECLESILEQTYKNYEVILIDDGSTDRSGQICERYAMKDTRIHVYHQTNSGLSEARNTGIRKAIGEYILFIDSDDYIAERSLGRIYDLISAQEEQADLVFLTTKAFFAGKMATPLVDGLDPEQINGKTKDDVMYHLSAVSKFPASACAKAVRRGFIEENDLYFTRGIVSEDIDWCIAVFNNAKRFCCGVFDYYYYRKGRLNSITNTKTNNYIKSYMYMYDKWASRDETKTEYQKVINSFFAYEYLILLCIFSRLDRAKRKEYARAVKAYQWTLKYKKGKRYRLSEILLKMLGTYITGRILSLYKRLVNYVRSA